MMVSIIILLVVSLIHVVHSSDKEVWGDVDVNEDSVIDAALFAANVLSDRENSIYHKKLVRINEAQKQIVSGIKYRINLEMMTTNCRKNEIQRYDIEKCGINETQDSELCNVEVYVQAWNNKRELISSDCKVY